MEIAEVLRDLQSTVPAAESHGCLCGAICVAGDYSFDRWLEEVVLEDEAAQAPQDALPLKLLFDDTHTALRGNDMDFELLVPDDDAPLQERVNALSQWCQGFLYGFGTGEVKADEELPANVSEILSDIAQIGRATIDLGEADAQEQEEAYMEVIEYLRVGVQLIHDEFDSARAEKHSRTQLN